MTLSPSYPSQACMLHTAVDSWPWLDPESMQRRQAQQSCMHGQGKGDSGALTHAPDDASISSPSALAAGYMCLVHLLQGTA